MSIKLAVPETSVMHLKPRISVIGVGGGGGNAVNNMIAQKLEGVDFIVANTDAQALAHSSASRKIQLGLETTQGLGAGARPEVGKLAAEEAKAEIEKELEGANMVFITAGMGGGTGSGAAPVVAKIAKEKGILTVGVVTKPFQFEGRKRMETAENAVENFTQEVDSIIIIPNQNLFRIADKKTTLADAFVMADNVLYAGVRSITDLMMMPGLINLDFADIKSIMKDKGKAIMGTGEAEGEDRAVKAAEQALSNPLLDDCSMHGAKGVLINITGGSDITLFEIDEAASRIKEEVDEDANIIFGSSYDESLAGKIRVSIVATGIGDNVAAKPKANNVQDYIAESYKEEKVSTSIAPNVEIDSNLEKFAANQQDDTMDIEEVIEQAEVVAMNANKAAEEVVEEVVEENIPVQPVLKPAVSDDLDMLQQSQVMEDMPKASSLFKAIINKNEGSTVSDTETLNNILSSNENVFSAKTNVRRVEEEPELFAEPAPTIFAPKREEEEKLIVNDEEEEYTPTLIERVTGFSIARRNRKKLKENERLQEPISPTFSDDLSDEDKMNLDIPSFLRRR